MDIPRHAGALLTTEQEKWIADSVALWQRARALAEANPGHDVTDLYHALRFLELSPAERLGIGRGRARLRVQRA